MNQQVIIFSYKDFLTKTATVRFHYGRTETVRSASNEAKAFVEAMDANIPDSEKLKKLQAATKKHVRTMRAATNGDGIDRSIGDIQAQY